MLESCIAAPITVSESVNGRYFRHMQSSQSTPDWSWISPTSASFITSRARLTVSQFCTAVSDKEPLWLDMETRGPHRSTCSMAIMSVIWGPLLLWSREDKWRSPVRYTDRVGSLWASCGRRQNWIRAPIWHLMEVRAWGAKAADCGVTSTRGQPYFLHNSCTQPIWPSCSSTSLPFHLCLPGQTRRISLGLSSAAAALLLCRWCEPIRTCSTRTHTCLL